MSGFSGPTVRRNWILTIVTADIADGAAQGSDRPLSSNYITLAYLNLNPTQPALTLRWIRVKVSKNEGPIVNLH